MCLIALALEQHEKFPLVLATNRDEVHARPTEPMHWWRDRPVLAGRDGESGGTWLALQESGALALVTNYRSGIAESGKRSRGEIPLALLEQTAEAENVRELYQRRGDFGGFNLITGRDQDWFYCGSEDRVPLRQLFRGLYGLSNHLLQSDWPKVMLSRQLMSQSLIAAGGNTAALHDALIGAFRDDHRPSEALLPDTGVGLELERFLSPLFIVGETYGTRSTTVVTIDRTGEIQVSEQRYGRGGVAVGRHNFVWQAAG